ncbi:INO80 complex subunit E [Didymella heteroderae]|uniref:INO80 complex subunit E n=1 Tax=Didymella heteroderae TaxID=1769908 RepID=A0A9P4WRK7_9PLEO|nr:INO80 complex subunit E [Didymella heteroderae]
MSAYPIYQIPFLGGYNSQQITYMSAQLSDSVPYHEVFPDEPALNWAMLAHAFDYAAPPREALAYFGTTWCQYWLPSQADFNNWNAEDVGILRAACAACNIWLDWALLDQFGVQAQLVRDPSESVALHGAWQEQAPERGFQTQTAHHLLLPTESQAKKYRQVGALKELSTPRDDDHVGPADDPAQADQSKLSLEESASVKSRSIEEDLLRNLLVYHAPSALNPPTSQLPNIGPRNREAATNLFLPARKGSVPQHDGEAAADRQSSSNIATQPAKSPRKKKELKRFEFELNAMLRPSNEIDTTIQLPTAANRAAYSPDTSWYKPKNPMEVGKVPETDEELRPYVLIMKKSMMDTSKAEDKKDERSSFRKRWSPAALAKRWPVSLEAMEAICWIIAKMARQYHRDGPAFLNLFDELHQARANRNQDLTFEERIETICTVLLISKARVDKCLKYESLGSLVAFPLSILGMSIANRPFNNTRKAKLEAGTKWLKQEAEERAKAEGEAAAKSATDESVPVDDRIASADDNKADLQDGAGEEVEEENEEIEDGEEVEIDEEEDDADEDADDNAEEDDDDDGDGGGEGDNEKSAGCAGGKTGFSPPDAISNVEADRDNAYQSGRANESNAPTSPSKALSTSNSIHQALTKPPSTPFSSRASGTKMSSKSPAHGVTVHYADPLLQLGLDLSPAPKRSRIAMCTNPDDAAMHSTPATIAQPTLAPPPKRRATEAGMGDTNTRGKSARSVDRQIIAPKRRSAPKESANQGALPLEAGLGKNGSV